MKRSGSNNRAPSPTPTTFSGISTYRSDSFRTKSPGNPPAMPSGDGRATAQVHFTELSRYLQAYLARSSPSSRSAARQKLTRLTKQQFQELSTDVFDELMRRTKNTEESASIPFLPVRDEFHPKRNQARQKLATLPATRFEDLSSDVYYELMRRYPEFKEQQQMEKGDGDPQSPTSEYANAVSPRTPDIRGGTGAGPDYPSASTMPNRRPSGDDNYPPPRPSGESSRVVPPGPRRRPTDEDYLSRTSGEENQPRSGSTPNRNQHSDSPSMGSSRFGQEGGRPSGESRRPRAYSNASEGTAQTSAVQVATATSGVVIPNISTMSEEEISVPFGRERESGLTERETGESTNGRPRKDEDSDYERSNSPQFGLSGLSARLQVDPQDARSPMSESVYDSPARGPNSARGPFSAGLATDQVKKDYESRIADMQQRIDGLERESQAAGGDRIFDLENEIQSLNRRTEEQADMIRALQRDLEAARANGSNRLNDGDVSQGVVDQLRTDMEGLLAELNDLNRSNDELMAARDQDQIVLKEVDLQMQEYKKKYEQAKTELRSVKVTSQLFTPPPKAQDGQLPISATGVIADIHITGFLSSIDLLLQSARNSSPSRVLTPAKNVVNAVHVILDDVRAVASTADNDLEALRERMEATLSNLVTACRTHATSAGMSPVSLVDAAASHVSATVTDLGRVVGIKRATRSELDAYQAPQQSATTPASLNGFLTPIRPDEGKLASPIGAAQTKNSPLPTPTRSYTNGSSDSVASPVQLTARFGGTEIIPNLSNGRSPIDERRPFADSPSPTNSPLALSVPTNNAYESREPSPINKKEEGWAELKPYLEAQTESIVYAIQAVLSGVRSPTPSPSLTENLTQIITIVSSIVAVCHDNLPPEPAAQAQGKAILTELTEHADRLSEVQEAGKGEGTLGKEARQVMAKSSFAVANAMKGLMKL